MEDNHVEEDETCSNTMNHEMPSLAEVATSICLAVEKNNRKEVQNLLLQNEEYCLRIFEYLVGMRKCKRYNWNTKRRNCAEVDVKSGLSEKNGIETKLLISALFMLPISHKIVWLMIKQVIVPYCCGGCTNSAMEVQDEFWIRETRVFFRSIHLCGIDSSVDEISMKSITKNLKDILNNIDVLYYAYGFYEMTNNECSDKIDAGVSCDYCANDNNYKKAVLSRASKFLPDIVKASAFQGDQSCNEIIDKTLSILILNEPSVVRVNGLSYVLSIIDGFTNELLERHWKQIRCKLFLSLQLDEGLRRKEKSYIVGPSDYGESLRYCLQFLCICSYQTSYGDAKLKLGKCDCWEGIIYQLFLGAACLADQGVMLSVENILHTHLSSYAPYISARLVLYLEALSDNASRTLWVESNMWLLLFQIHTSRHSMKLASVAFRWESHVFITEKRILDSLFYPIIDLTRNGLSCELATLKRCRYCYQGRFSNIDNDSICDAANIVFKSLVGRTEPRKISGSRAIHWLNACLKLMTNADQDAAILSCVVKVLVTVFFEDPKYREIVINQLVEGLHFVETENIVGTSKSNDDIFSATLAVIKNSSFQKDSSGLHSKENHVLRNSLMPILMLVETSDRSRSVIKLPLSIGLTILDTVLHFTEGKVSVFNFARQQLVVTSGTLSDESHRDSFVGKSLAIHALCSLISIDYYVKTDTICHDSLKLICKVTSFGKPPLSIQMRSVLYSNLGSMLKSGLFAVAVADRLISSIIYRALKYFVFEKSSNVLSMTFSPDFCITEWKSVFEEKREFEIRDDFIGMFLALGDAMVYLNRHNNSCVSTCDLTSCSRNQNCSLAEESSTSLQKLLIACFQSLHAFLTIEGKQYILFSNCHNFREIYHNLVEKIGITVDICDNNDVFQTKPPSYLRSQAFGRSVISSVCSSLCSTFVDVLLNIHNAGSSLSSDFNSSTAMIVNELLAIMIENGQNTSPIKPSLCKAESFTASGLVSNEEHNLCSVSNFLRVINDSRPDKLLQQLHTFDRRASNLFLAIGFHADKAIEILSELSSMQLSSEISIIQEILVSSCNLYSQMGTEEKARMWIEVIESTKESDTLNGVQISEEEPDDIVRLLRNRLLLVMTKSIIPLRKYIATTKGFDHELDIVIHSVMKSTSVVALKEEDTIDEPSCSFCYLLDRLVYDLVNGFNGLSGAMTSATYKIMTQCIGEIYSICCSYSDVTISSGSMESMRRLIDSSISELWNLLCRYGLRHSSLLRYTLRLVLQDLPSISRRVSLLGCNSISEVDELVFVSLKQCVDLLVKWYDKQFMEKLPCWVYSESDSDTEKQAMICDEGTNEHINSKLVIKLRSSEMWSVAMTSTLSALECYWSSSMDIIKGKGKCFQASINRKHMKHRCMILSESLVSLYTMTKPIKSKHHTKMVAPRAIHLFSSPSKEKVLSCIDKIVTCLRLSIQTVEASLKGKNKGFDDALVESVICVGAIICSKKKTIQLFHFLHSWLSAERQGSALSTKLNVHFDDEPLLDRIESTLAKVEILQAKLHQFLRIPKKETTFINDVLLDIIEGSSVLDTMYSMISDFTRDLASCFNRSTRSHKETLEDDDFAASHDALFTKNKKRRDQLNRKRKSSDVPRSMNQALDSLIALDAVDGYEQDNDAFFDLEDFIE